MSVLYKSDMVSYTAEYVQKNGACGHINKSTENSETPDTNFDPQTPSFADTTAHCSACHTLSPYSQLFVCLREGCKYALQQQVAILSPSMFYRREKVFCGACAFRGFHSPHKKFMRKAEPIAFQTASGEMGAKLQMEFDKFTETSEDFAVGYYMADTLGSEKLPEMKLADYLSKSENILEWHRRVAVLHDALKTLNDYRTEGQNFVREQADKFLIAYSQLSKEVAQDLIIDKPERDQLTESRKEDHRRNMGEEEAGYSSFSSISSGRSSVRSNATSSTVLERASSQQAQVLDELDAEVTGGVSQETVDKNLQKKIQGKADLAVCADLVRQFEVKRRFSTVEEAIHQAVAGLHARIQSSKNKKAFVEYMEKRFSIKWP